MISFARSGPESLVLHVTDKVEEIREGLVQWGTKIDLSPEMALRVYGVNRRLIFFIAMRDGAAEEEAMEAYVSENSIELLLCTLINKRLISGVEDIRLLPGFIMMRLLGDFEKGIEAVRKDLGGEIVDRDPLFRGDIPSTSSRIFFTKRALNKPVPNAAMYKKTLLVHDRSKGAIIQFLSARGMEYLGSALGTPDWNDVEIKIYDANGFFDLHRQRLWIATQGLQIGTVLEEYWGKDQALSRRSVPVYVLKIFTPIDVQEIKRLAIGLEYDGMGQRWADFDVFYKDNKISAYTELDSHPGLSRNAIGMLYRNDVIKNLDSDSRNELLHIENEIHEKGAGSPNAKKN